MRQRISSGREARPFIAALVECDLEGSGGLAYLVR